ncbi:NAD+ diphosphatase [Synchytrium microbalum]|uniref:NAD(+) diphosphatase n=1 Tax=Synchytrium microbalum TaxID=1806994 RepID=A0A507C0G7_9FUNG|nr:NAD+ diphosphatase [Synchytrium microbalum]TPX31075.1 NAD+ diphosphatase [Synchytrium microbalum]
MTGHHSLDPHNFGNFYSGNNLNRKSVVRTDKAELAKLKANERTRYLAHQKLHVLYVDPAAETAELAYLSYQDILAAIGEDGTVSDDSWTSMQPVLMGVDESDENRVYWAIDVTSNDKMLQYIETKGLGKFSDARPTSFKLGPLQASYVAQARALLDWNLRHPFCPMCGSKTTSEEAGYKRKCPNASCLSNGRGVQNFQYPRTDPVIIVCIVSSDGKRCVLGRQKVWPAKMYSCIAGFLEAGESLEEGVRREAWEETNVKVGKVIYHSSQPWPFPNSLMIGCVAMALTDSIHLEDKELDDAQWFTREEVLESLNASQTIDVRTEGAPESEKPAPKFWMPPGYAIANQIVAAWARQEITL